MVFSFGNKTLELWGPRFWKFGQLTIVSVDLSVRWKGDHSPSFYFLPCVMNLQLFEIHWYDCRHEEDICHG